MGQVHRADERHLRTADAVALFWVVLWLVVGIWVGHQVFQLARLGESLSRSGQALDSSGQALQELRGVPLVGNRTGAFADQVRGTAAELISRGRQSQTAVRRLGVLLGLTTTLVPAGPVLLLYLPARVHRGRQRRQLLELLTRDGGDQDLEALLAHRALLTLPHGDLKQVTDTPVGDYRSGRYRHLADAELRRLGVHRIEC